MASTTSRKAAGSGSGSGSASRSSYNVNASSMMSLLSEVSRQSDAHKRGAMSSTSKRGSLDSNDDDDHGGDGAPTSRKAKAKRTGIFDRANRGIEARSARDRSHMLARADLSEEARRVLESREMMEKKAQLYERLAKGEHVHGVTREQLRQGLLVDFEGKAIEESYRERERGRRYNQDDGSDSSGSSDGEDNKDESRTVPGAPGKAKARSANSNDDDDDELTETTDDFGRTRWVRKSQLAREEAERPRGSVIDDGALPYYSTDISLASHEHAGIGTLPEKGERQNVYYGDQREFGVYTATEEELAERRKRFQLDNPLNLHFDSTKEVRNRGAGYMQLSGDEETRKRQMDELRSLRDETEQKREAREAEGAPGPEARRQKELADRRRLVEEKKKQILEKRKAPERLKEEELVKRPRT